MCVPMSICAPVYICMSEYISVCLRACVCKYVYVCVLRCIYVFVWVGNHLMTYGRYKCSMSDLTPVLSAHSLAVGCLAKLPNSFTSVSSPSL